MTEALEHCPGCQASMVPLYAHGSRHVMPYCCRPCQRIHQLPRWLFALHRYYEWHIPVRHPIPGCRAYWAVDTSP